MTPKVEVKQEERNIVGLTAKELEALSELMTYFPEEEVRRAREAELAELRETPLAEADTPEKINADFHTAHDAVEPLETSKEKLRAFFARLGISLIAHPRPTEIREAIGRGVDLDVLIAELPEDAVDVIAPRKMRRELDLKVLAQYLARKRVQEAYRKAAVARVSYGVYTEPKKK